MTEDELLTGLIDAAAAGGWLWYHVRGWHPGMIQGTIGFPDLVLCHAERRTIAFLECKAERGRVDEAQERWIAALRAAGVEARVVRPADYDETWTWLVGDRLIRRRRP
jgi:hypothetical protein